MITNNEYNYGFIGRIHKNRVFKIQFKYQINKDLEDQIDAEDDKDHIPFIINIIRAIPNSTELVARDTSLEGSIVRACYIIINENNSE